MSENIATQVKELDGFQGEARLYRLSQPVAYDYDWENDTYKSSTNFVVVSAASAVFSGPETYIFPAGENGKVVDWCELEGSFKGGLDHEQALRNAGWEVSK
jgi:hypothetical protein